MSKSSRRRSATILLSLLALFGAAQIGVSQAAATTQANLLTDGGFEAGGVGWQTFPVAGQTVNMANYSGSRAHDGTHYEEANTSTDGGSIYQDVPVSMTTDQSATFSIWARLAPGVPDTGQSVNLCLWALTGAPKAACRQQTLTDTWQQLQATATMPSATDILRAQLYMYGRGNIDFDGGVLSPDLLTDGGFEAGGVGWQTFPVAGQTVNMANYSGSRAHDGTHYEEANTSTDGGSIYQDVPVSMTTDQSATFSIWARLAPGVPDTGQSVNLCLWALTGSPKAACHDKVLTDTWQQLQATATMPSATDILRAQLYMYGRGNIDFDGASLTPDLLTDGGFEAGGAGWQTFPVAGQTVNMANYSGSSAHDGTHYEEANTSTDGGSIYQDVPVSMTTDQSATFSIWARLAPGVPDTGQSVNLCLWALTGAPKAACQQKTLTGSWEELQATATMPSTTDILRAQLYMYGRGNIDFDGAGLGAPQTADEFYPPRSSTAPRVTGSISIGSTLTCSEGTWSNDPTSFSYVWQEDGSPIAAASAPTHTITQADAGSRLSCAVTATNPAGSAAAESNSVTAGTDPTVTRPVTTRLPRSKKRRALKVPITVSWTWNHAWTRLTRIRVGRLPRHATITIACRGRSCPQRAHEARDRHVRSRLRALTGTRYHAGDQILITLRAPGRSPERVEILIRDGRLPAAKLL
jgi:hypothetical protein